METKKFLRYDSDYMEGAHPVILEKLLETNFEKTPGYGTDDYCKSAREKILKACEIEDGEVYLLVGGTQTNKTVIDAFLRPYQGVISADTGHINVHEAGAIESTGHKVLTLPQKDGKLVASDVRKYLESFYQDSSYEHMVIPGMIYISHPTETGTLYTAQELKDLHELCQEYNLPLFMDGARLGYGLVAKTDVTLPLIAKYCDAFYIGGTKCGALFGEAVVFPKKNTCPHFFTTMKRQGALLAKGRMLGIQFDCLFTDNLYMNISKQAIESADYLEEKMTEKGYTFVYDSSTNQKFVLLEDEKMEELSKSMSFTFWEKYDESHTVVRFVTSWATTKEDIDELLERL